MQSDGIPFLWRIMRSISFIGTGNVATHLAQEFHAKGIRIHQICGRNRMSVDDLCIRVGSQPVYDISKLDTAAVDAVLIAVSDDQIETVAGQIPPSETVVAHTSGTTALSALKNHARHGVFYPLQTFSKNKEIHFSQVPFCIEGSHPEVENQLIELAQSISKNVQKIDSEERKIIHISAVFACNFSNHMLAIAQKLLGSSNTNFHILEPLIRETIEKAFATDPRSAQTGPAKRNDQKVIQNHLQLLSDYRELRDIYQKLTDSIIQFSHE